MDNNPQVALSSDGERFRQSKYLSRFGVFALSLGCSVGWGSFVMPGTTFLPIAGPLGTLLGMIIGALLMILIGANYRYMMGRCRSAGGAYSFAKMAFGLDHGFLNAWFLLITYVAVLWANATAATIFVRALFGSSLQFVHLYTIAGFDIYLGEALVHIALIVVFGLICMLKKQIAGWLQIGFASLLVIGILVCFIGCLANGNNAANAFTPAFSSSSSPAAQIISIVVLAPWAFVGFESVSHSSEEFKFEKKRFIPIMAIAIIVSSALYSMLAIIATTAIPDGYASWQEYVADLGSLEGRAMRPTFFAAENAMGSAGLWMLGLGALGGILTGIIGNFIASSRLLFVMAEDQMLPKVFARTNRYGTPYVALSFLIAISLIIPFLGNTAIGWIVDVTTIGATIAYGYCSATVLKFAIEEKKKLFILTGIAGIVLSIGFAFAFLVPNLLPISAMSDESYLILVIWSILGIVYFQYLFKKDEKRALGKSMVVWLALIVIMFLVSLLWMYRSSSTATAHASAEISDYYERMIEEAGTGVWTKEQDLAAIEYTAKVNSNVNRTLLINGLVQLLLMTVALLAIFRIHAVQNKRERTLEMERYVAEQRNKAKSAFLSNMSHDIRTPMNAISGYTTLARSEDNIPDKVREYLDKIEVSNKQLLSLVNDILDMSRIESGKMELDPVDGDIARATQEIHEMFLSQMTAKSIDFRLDLFDVTDPVVRFDKNRYVRILLNLISNAYKFTPEGGKVFLNLRQIKKEDKNVTFEVRVKDTGIGMSEDFLKRIFNEFERERSKTINAIQGTGLGMSITKNFVDLMGGEITVNSKLGLGSEFTITLTFPIAEKDTSPLVEVKEDEKHGFSGCKVLLVDDNPINREIAHLILDAHGFIVEEAENGKDALIIIRDSVPGEYSAILMDVMMPIMNGYEATRAIRELKDPLLANIPIIAMTANAFSEDIEEAKNAGMNAHLAKPIDVEKLIATLTRFIQ